MKILKSVGVAFAVAGAVAALAEQPQKPETDKGVQLTNEVALAATVDYSYVAQGDVKFRGSKVGQSDAQRVIPSVFGEIPVGEKWFVPLGVATEHVFLDGVSGAPMPEKINTMRLSCGVGYRFNEQWNVVVGAGPLFYNLEEVDSQNIGFGGMIRTVYKASPEWTFAAGLAVAPDSEYPVFPAMGAIWKARPDLTVNLMVPKPRVIYKLTDTLNVYAGGEMRFAVFRTDSSIESNTGVAGFNNALGTYRDFHIGVGVDYELVKGLFAEAEAGYSVGREIDYTRIDERVKFDPAPYVHVGVRYRF